MRVVESLLVSLVLGSWALGCAGNEPRATPARTVESPPVVAVTAGDEALPLIEDFDDGMHDTEFRPSTADAVRYCAATNGRVCWSELVTPTPASEARLARYRALAAEERARSAALRAAEAQACAGLTDEDRDVSPLAHREDIRWVHEIVIARADGRSVTDARTVGATILFARVPGLTAEGLANAIACHLARSAALAYDRPGFEGCPLALPDVEARVRTVPEGFAVDLRSPSTTTAHAIWTRVRELAPAS